MFFSKMLSLVSDTRYIYIYVIVHIYIYCTLILFILSFFEHSHVKFAQFLLSVKSIILTSCSSMRIDDD